MDYLPLGKLKSEILTELLEKHRQDFRETRVIMGPQTGVDVSVIKTGTKYIVIKTDPITFATDSIGWYAVNINANDIATSGAKPMYFQPTVLLPEKKTTKELVDKIFSDVYNACQELGVLITGGHTEVTYGIDRPIVAGLMIGETDKEPIVASNAKLNDYMILVGGYPIEGAAIIASAKEEELLKKGYTKEFIKKAKNYLFEPGISIVKYVNMIKDKYAINSMHDPTEGGIANGAVEIAESSGLGIRLIERNLEEIMLPESKKLCKEYKLNPLGTITSGALLLTAEQETAKQIVQHYKNNNVTASIIGVLLDKKNGYKIETKNGITKLGYSQKDEITKLFE